MAAPCADIEHDAPDGVRNAETLQRGVRAEWLDDEGSPTSAAFPVADLKDPDRRGISVHRRSPSEVAGTVPALARWPALVAANAGDIRAIRSQEGCQAFEVDAVPTPEDAGHALVRIANPPASPRLERDKLLDVFRDPAFAAAR